MCDSIPKTSVRLRTKIHRKIVVLYDIYIVSNVLNNLEMILKYKVGCVQIIYKHKPISDNKLEPLGFLYLNGAIGKTNVMLWVWETFP